jgi:hypothetical protein
MLLHSIYCSFPEVSLTVHEPNASRLLQIHKNRYGVLTQLNQIFGEEEG